MNRRVFFLRSVVALKEPKEDGGAIRHAVEIERNGKREQKRSAKNIRTWLPGIALIFLSVGSRSSYLIKTAERAQKMEQCRIVYALHNVPSPGRTSCSERVSEWELGVRGANRVTQVICPTFGCLCFIPNSIELNFRCIRSASHTVASVRQ